MREAQAGELAPRFQWRERDTAEVDMKLKSSEADITDEN